MGRQLLSKRERQFVFIDYWYYGWNLLRYCTTEQWLEGDYSGSIFYGES